MNILVLFFFLLSSTPLLLAQEDVADQIKKDRASDIDNLNKSLEANKLEIARLNEELSALKENDVRGRMQKLEELNTKQDERLTILENKRKTSISANGQLAFAELLNLQNDIKPIELFSASQRFFNALGNIDNLQQYPTFASWKAVYDPWYEKKAKGNKAIDFIDQSIRLVSNSAGSIPLYGSIVNTVSSGILSIIGGVGKDHKELVEKTPNMLTLLNVLSQFESQKAMIDHEWQSINEELEALKNENKKLLDEQVEFYDLNGRDLEAYTGATLDREQEEYKKRFKRSIERKMNEMENAEATAGIWMLRVEKYMSRVQSIRIRFGQLASRMFTNLKRYDEIVSFFSDPGRFPAADPIFSRNIGELRLLLSNVKNTFERSFNPTRYIEDSAVMYID